MKWRAYPKYKDSNIEWLKEIPEGWSVAPLKRGLARNDGGVWGEDFDDDGTIVLRSTEIALDGSWRIVEPARRRLTARERIDAHLEIGDLLVTKSSGSALHLGKTAVVTEDIAAMNCCYSNFTQRLRVNNRLHPRYLFWILNGPVGRDQLVFLGTTTTGLANLGAEIIGAVRIPFLPLPEQRAIATFLDRETERIDALIARKERQIELLQEKRAALISHIVTKGLDPNAPMKDSGVEWLGEIPEHWDVWKATHAFQQMGSGTTPKSDELNYYDGEIPWVTTSELRETTILDTDNKLTEQALRDYSSLHIYPAGTLLVAMYGATVGRMGILGIPATVNQACCAFSDPKSLDPRFTFYWLWMRRPILITLSKGGGQPNLSQEDLRSIRIPAPSLPEQRAIAAFLDRETEHIDTLVKKVQDSIDKLREYRTALISATVTGKIDVRQEVA